MRQSRLSNEKFLNKNPRMYGLIIFLWIATILHFNPRLLALLAGPENMLAKSTIIGFTLLLDLFWFYGFYYLVIILFSYYKKSNIFEGQHKDTNLLFKKPAVALLYTTCDDFDEEAVLSCFNQNYSNFHTFILDDSGGGEYKKRIDEFESKYR